MGDDALDLRELVEHVVVVENLLDVGGHIVPELGGPLLPVAALAVAEKAAFGRQMLVFYALAAFRLAFVGRNSGVVEVQLDGLAPNPGHELLADEPPGSRVAGTLDHSLAISTKRRRPPQHRLPRTRRKRQHRGALDSLEDLEGTLVRGAVPTHPRDLSEPAVELAPQHCHVLLLRARFEEVALDVLHPRLDLPLLFGAVGRRGVDLEAEVPRQLAVAPVEHRRRR